MEAEIPVATDRAYVVPAVRSVRRDGPIVVVLGGGNAGLCAALSACDRGARVLILERAPRPFRGGNSRHTRNLRTAHATGDGFVTGAYTEDELLADLIGVTGPDLDRELARLCIHESETMPPWMWAHGARWQASLKGTLGLARTNRFFLGGGKALVNAYYEDAEARGVEILYDTCATELDIVDGRCRAVVVEQAGEPRRIACDAVVVASGGFEANLEWLKELWGPRAGNFMVRGTRYNDGLLLRVLYGHGARRIGNPLGMHAIAVDARGPKADGGIVTRLDSIPLGIAVNRDCERFGDEGEDIWPKRYATWGRRIADQPDQVAFSIFDSRIAGHFIPGLYPMIGAATIAELATKLGLDATRLEATIRTYNEHLRPGGTWDLSQKDDCTTEGLTPPKSHWAQPIDTAPFYAFPLRVGVTFTYLGVGVDPSARVLGEDGTPFANLLAAGEIMAGSILTQGYLAGFGMTIGSVFGRIAGWEAVQHA